MTDSLNLSSLWPDLSSLNVMPPQTPEQLSALFVVILWGVALFFLIWSVAAFIRARQRVVWLHISEHSDQSFRDYPITHFGLNRSLIPRLSDHF